MSNAQAFETELTAQYADLFVSQAAQFAYAAARNTPAQLAAKMTAGLAAGSANLGDSPGIRRACKALGIPYTQKAIRAYLTA